MNKEIALKWLKQAKHVFAQLEDRYKELLKNEE